MLFIFSVIEFDAYCSVFFTVERFPEVFWPKTMRYYRSIGYALSFFHSALETLIDFLFSLCSRRTARGFNKSTWVLITGSKLKAFRNLQSRWRFARDKSPHENAGKITLFNAPNSSTRD